MYKEKFVLSILHDGHPVKETGTGSNREVAIPFGSEYKIRLKNKNNRSCTARVFVDGRKLSVLGDIVVSAGGTVDLERFIDRSLSNGKRFRFVSLDDPNVDDPTDSSNGIIRVEFRLAKEEVINITPPKFPQSDWHWFNWEDNNGPRRIGGDPNFYCPDKLSGSIGNDIRYTSNCGGTKSSAFYNCSTSRLVGASEVENGSTVEGSKSNQSFSYTDLEVVDHPVILQLKLVGLKEKDRHRNINYCNKCGSKVRTGDRYCSSCGNKIK